ncbi:hypothetical protein [Paenibacillus agaridevorans]|nr:hypothetical protein [Paenibacillus agaridevorans]
MILGNSDYTWAKQGGKIGFQAAARGWRPSRRDVGYGGTFHAY